MLPVRQQGGRISNDPSLPPDDSESVNTERVGDVAVLRVGFSLGIPNERARCETAVAFPSRMLSRVVLAVIHAADG